MDEKLKKQVIAICVIMIGLVITTVLFVDYLKKSNNRNPVEESEEITEDIIYDKLEGSELAKAYNLNPYKDPYAFLGDEEFFEPEVVYVDPSMNLSLLVSSVEKDMRVNVVDGFGNLVKDHRFSVAVTNGKGETKRFQDGDKDGSIYIAPLDSGQYDVSLFELGEYTLSDDSSVSVVVKDQVDYTIIDDISFLIKSEDEIDAAIEDTGVNEAEQDADGTETNKRLTKEDALFGIDVSKWNKEIDWDAVKSDGVEFAIIRCGYRGSSTGALVEDPYFRKNIEGAQAAGVKVGIYFFTQATTEAEAVEEASMALSLCKGQKIALPIFIDTEGAGGNGRADALDVDTRTAVCDAFCKTIDKAGYTGGIYASKHWLNNNLKMDELKDFTIWLAQYSKEATYEGDYSLWQYTSAGTVKGIDTRVDLNLSYVKY